jgi:hypothetical protein
MKPLRPLEDLTQDTAKIELFDVGGVAGIPANFIFASPRDRKATPRSLVTPGAKRES